MGKGVSTVKVARRVGGQYLPCEVSVTSSQREQACVKGARQGDRGCVDDAHSGPRDKRCVSDGEESLVGTREGVSCSRQIFPGDDGRVNEREKEGEEGKPMPECPVQRDPH